MVSGRHNGYIRKYRGRNPGDGQILLAEEELVLLIAADEVLDAQLNKEECRSNRVAIEKGVARGYKVDGSGIVSLIALSDGSVQYYIPEVLHARALHLAHHTPVGGHPGVSKQYYTMRRATACIGR